MNLIGKINKARKEHGVKKTFLLLANAAIRIPVDHLFDLKHGVDTGGIISPEKLDVTDSQMDDANQYEPTPVPAARTLLKRLSVDHSRYAFIDFGSGKGRVLLLASEYPYKEIIGVEFSRKLHQIAEENIRKWKDPGQRCRCVRSVCSDAREFKLPETPLVLFFFSPFKPYVARQIIRNIKKDLMAVPRPVWVVYYGSNQEFLDLLSELDFSGKEVYSSRPFTAQKHYKGYVFRTGKYE